MTTRKHDIGLQQKEVTTDGVSFERIDQLITGRSKPNPPAEADEQRAESGFRGKAFLYRAAGIVCIVGRLLQETNEPHTAAPRSGRHHRTTPLDGVPQETPVAAQVSGSRD